MKEGRKPEYPEKTLATRFRKCHILQSEDSSPKRDSNPRSSIGGRLRNDNAEESSLGDALKRIYMSSVRWE